MYMQVPSGAGKEDKVGKMTDVSAIVPLLLLAILIHLQSEYSLSPSSLCSYQTKPRVCCEVISSFIVKVSSMVDNGQGHYRRGVDKAAFWRPLQC